MIIRLLYSTLDESNELEQGTRHKQCSNNGSFDLKVARSKTVKCNNLEMLTFDQYERMEGEKKNKIHKRVRQWAWKAG